MLDIVGGILAESWLVLGQMAPYLLFGFLAAGVLSVCISPSWVERHLGGSGLGPVLKASLFGVPLPLCSCSVIPVSVSIHRHGASRAATTAFLLSTPQTGVDSIAVTYALLGPIFAIFRPLTALLTGFIGGGLVQILGEPKGTDATDESKPATCTEACCAGKHRMGVLTRTLHYGFVTLPQDIGLALMAGILIAGTMAALVPPDHLVTYIGSGVISITLMMMAGVPLYVCATASVPIAAGLMHMGASPGAALAFLIAGPATNAATFTTIWKVLGRRTATLYLLTVGASALCFGLLLDWLMPIAEMSLPQLAVHTHFELETRWLGHLGASLLLVVLIWSYIRRNHSSSEETGVSDSNATGSGASHTTNKEILSTSTCCSHSRQGKKDDGNQK